MKTIKTIGKTILAISYPFIISQLFKMSALIAYSVIGFVFWEWNTSTYDWIKEFSMLNIRLCFIIGVVLSIILLNDKRNK